MNITPNRAGLVLGISFAIYHSLWLLAVLMGLGDLLLNWAHNLHFIVVDHQLATFDLLKAFIGIAGVFVMGYGTGWIFGAIWQKTKSVK